MDVLIGVLMIVAVGAALVVSGYKLGRDTKTGKWSGSIDYERSYWKGRLDRCTADCRRHAAEYEDRLVTQARRFWYICTYLWDDRDRERRIGKAAIALATERGEKLNVVQAWINGPKDGAWICLWCLTPIPGGAVAAKSHVLECPANPLVQERAEVCEILATATIGFALGASEAPDLKSLAKIAAARISFLKKDFEDNNYDDWEQEDDEAETDEQVT